MRRTSSVEQSQLKFFIIFFDYAKMYFKVFLIPAGVVSGLQMADSDALAMYYARSNSVILPFVTINYCISFRKQPIKMLRVVRLLSWNLEIRISVQNHD